MSDHPGHEPTTPTSVTRAPMRPLSPDWPRAERVSWYVFDAVVLLPTLIALVVTSLRDFEPLPYIPLFLAWALTAAVMLWATLAYPQAAHRRAAIGVGPFGVEFHRGLWWRKITIIPRSRVQHTDVSQGPIMRRYGLGKLVIHTAGTRNAVVEIPGLAYEDAQRIRDQLLDEHTPAQTTPAQAPPAEPPHTDPDQPDHPGPQRPGQHSPAPEAPGD